MRILTRRARHCVCLFLVMAVALLGFSIPASAGQADGLCKADHSRGTVPADYILEGCFDGATMLLVNHTDLPLEVGLRGVTGTPKRSPRAGVPDIPSAVFTFIDPAAPTLIMPGYQLALPVGENSVTFTVHGTRHNRTYVIVRALTAMLGAGAVVDNAPTVVAFANEMSDVSDDYQNCKANGSLWQQVSCTAIYYRDINFAVGRLALSVKTPLKFQMIVALLETASWSAHAASDVTQLLKGTPSFTLDASANRDHPTAPPANPSSPPPTADSPDPGPLSFSIVGTCTTDSGTLVARTSNFTPGGTYAVTAWRPDGSLYPLGGGASGRVAPDGTIIWQWPCAGDSPGDYTTEVVDTSTGRATGRITFTIATGATPQTPPTSQPPPPPSTGTGTINIPPCLDLHNAVGHDATVIDCIPNGLPVTIECVAQGNPVTGPFGTTTIWDRVTYNGKTGYVTDAFVYTGTDLPVAPACR